MTTPTEPNPTMVEIDIDSVQPLRCPQCGNTGKDAAFNAATFVLIKEQGLPVVVGDYSEWAGEDDSPSTIDCHHCDHAGPIDEFRVAEGSGNEARE